MFVPQDAYIPHSSLLQAITYPLTYPADSGEISLQNLRSLLSSVDFGNLLKFQSPTSLLDPSSLSPGERQKILMARVLFHRPRIVFLDEISRFTIKRLFATSLIFLAPSMCLRRSDSTSSAEGMAC